MTNDAFKDIEKLESDLWEAADNLRANSKLTSSDYFILDNLWRALPRPPFTDEETEATAIRVYDFVLQQVASGHDLAAA